MSTRINRSPLGLLDFLQNPEQGNNPSELASDVRAVVDLTEFYKTPKLEIIHDDQSTTGNANIVFDVPTGETWLIHSVVAEFTPGNANNWVTQQIRANRPPGGTTGPIDFSLAYGRTPTDLAALEPWHLIYQPAVPWFLTTGMQLQYVTRRNSGSGTDIFDLSAQIYRYNT